MKGLLHFQPALLLVVGLGHAKGTSLSFSFLTYGMGLWFYVALGWSQWLTEMIQETTLGLVCSEGPLRGLNTW